MARTNEKKMTEQRAKDLVEKLGYLQKYHEDSWGIRQWDAMLYREAVGFLAGMEAQKAKEVKKRQIALEKAVSALRVINTWAGFRGGEALVPKHILEMTYRVLKEVDHILRDDKEATDGR